MNPEETMITEETQTSPAPSETSTNPRLLKTIIEASLLAAGQPLSLDRLLALFPEDAQPAREDLRAALAELAQDFTDRGIELKEVASGWRLQVKAELSPWVSRLWEERPQRYSRALLETLVLIAYRQPITRAEIEEIRGVAVSSHIVKTLQEREWIRVVGHREVPGRPALFGTTRQFLDYFNLKSLDELPPLSEVKSLDEISQRFDPQVEEAFAALSQAAGEEAQADAHESSAPDQPETPTLH